MTRISVETVLRLTRAASLVISVAAAFPALAQDTQDADQVEPPGMESLAAASEPPSFATPEAALEAFKQALNAPDSGPLATLLGLDPAKLAADENTAETYKFIKENAAKRLSLDDDGDRRTVVIGEKLWPLPFPLVKWNEGEWAFDTYSGLEEIVNRRVGENELETIATMRAYVDAQEEYASVDRDGDGVREFAQKLVSSENATDGLYWPTNATDGESPAGDLDPGELQDAAKGEGYFGYKYKILTGQGDNIAGGAYDYIINGNMIAGFGLLAWPAEYGETGVKSFVINQNGVVYETDLGPDTATVVKYIDRFNPDDAWSIVND